MSTATPDSATPDYAALAQQAGAVSSAPGPQSAEDSDSSSASQSAQSTQSSGRPPDYAALAQQAGAVSSTSPSSGSTDQSADTAPGTITGQVATVSAPQQPASPFGRLAQWIDNVSADLKDGGDRTGVGTVMQKLGAHGLNNGNSAAVGDFMASLPLGLMKAAKGAAEIVPSAIGGETGNTWKGIKDLVGGGLQAIQEPAAFVAPEESPLSEEGLLPDAASKAADMSSRVIASRKAAGAALGEINDAIGDHPVAVDDAAEIANDILDKQETGAKLGGLKKTLVQFMSRATDPNDPLTFSEARDFEQNFNQLTPAQKMNLGAGVKPLLANLRTSLRQSIEDAADAGGQGDKFRAAMRSYRVAAQGEKGLESVKGSLGRAILKGVAREAGGAGLYIAGSKAYDAYNSK